MQVTKKDIAAFQASINKVNDAELSRRQFMALLMSNAIATECGNIEKTTASSVIDRAIANPNQILSLGSLCKLVDSELAKAGRKPLANTVNKVVAHCKYLANQDGQRLVSRLGAEKAATLGKACELLYATIKGEAKNLSK